MFRRNATHDTKKPLAPRRSLYKAKNAFSNGAVVLVENVEGSTNAYITLPEVVIALEENGCYIAADQLRKLELDAKAEYLTRFAGKDA